MNGTQMSHLILHVYFTFEHR